MGDSFKVLVIDDSPFIFKAVKKALEPNGFIMVGHAENGKIGLEMYDQFKPDIITLDVTMPVMDGLETAKNLHSQNSKVKIIMLSAMGDEDLMSQARAFGVKNFISKPFKAEELLNLVKSVLEIKI
jgi:two-component system, chemotaxis family, chemotaxis protein CheY